MQLIAPNGKRYLLKTGVNTVGRVMGNDIVLDDRAMSRRHAELHWDGQRCVVVDRGSTNGTFLDGQRLVSHQPQPVTPGARLGLGPTMVVTLVADAPDAETVYAPSGSPPPFRAEAPSATGLDLIFRALDVALDYRKFGLAFLGFVVGGLVAMILLWITAQVSLDSPVLGIAVGLVGIVILWLILTFVTAAITRLSFLELSEGQKSEVREALGYAGRHFLTFLVSPLVLVVGLALILTGEFMFLLLGRIDYLGEMVVALAFLPLVILNLLAILVVWFGAILTFPIVADRGGGIGDTLACILAIVRRAPGRLAAYMLLAGLTSLLVLVFCLYLISTALYTTLSLAMVGMEPDKFLVVFSGLPLDMGDLLPGLFSGGYGGYPWYDPPATFVVARFLLGLSLLGLAVLVLSIPQLFYLASACAVYLNLRGVIPDPGWGRKRAGAGQAREIEPAESRPACWQCGSFLSHGQIYCPHCGSPQR